MSSISHAFGLHLHQPPGNLQFLLEANESEALQIIHCYDRATRYAHKYPQTARLHVAFSGGLLEQLTNPEIIERYRHHMDIPAMLNSYRDASNIELLSTGYAHPIFTLIPEADWEDQLVAGRQQMEQLFGRAPQGFYPPAMMFSMAMIPALVKAGYRYVVLDSWLLKNSDGQGVSPFTPYTLSYEGHSITAVPRDVDMSNAQQNGLEAAWFADETRQRAAGEGDRLMTTWSDGENSPWFRSMDESLGFFGHFFAPYIEHVEGGEYPITPVSISEFIAANPAQTQVTVETPAWNPSEAQSRALAQISALSARYHSVNGTKPTAKQKAVLPQVQSLLRESETSCFMFWHDEWLGKIEQRVNQAQALLDEAAQAPAKPVAAAAPKPAVTKPTKAVSKAPAKAKSSAAATPKKTPAASTKAAAPSPAKPTAAAKTASVSKPATKPATTTAEKAPAVSAKPAESAPSPATPAAKPAAAKKSPAVKSTAASTTKTTKTRAKKTTPTKKS